MADSGFQLNVLDAVAKVVGGTVNPKDAHFYSGNLAGDSTGVAGLKGCWSAAPLVIESTPVAVVLPGPFRADLASQGEEDNEDDVKLLVLLARYDVKVQMSLLAAYRDTVPAAFRSHMGLYGAPGDLDAFVTHGNPGLHSYAGIDYLAWDFTVRVRRMLAVTYTL